MLHILIIIFTIFYYFNTVFHICDLYSYVWNFFCGNKLTLHIQLTFRVQQFLAYFTVAIPSARPTVNEAKKKWNSVGLKDESPVIEWYQRLVLDSPFFNSCSALSNFLSTNLSTWNKKYLYYSYTFLLIHDFRTFNLFWQCINWILFFM